MGNVDPHLQDPSVVSPPSQRAPLGILGAVLYLNACLLGKKKMILVTILYPLGKLCRSRRCRQLFCSIHLNRYNGIFSVFIYLYFFPVNVQPKVKLYGQLFDNALFTISGITNVESEYGKRSPPSCALMWK